MNIAQTIYLHISILEEVREYDRKTESGKRILPALCLFGFGWTKIFFKLVLKLLTKHSWKFDSEK